MSSIHGFMDGSYDYRFMYNIRDLRGPLPKPEIYSNTLLGVVVNTPAFAEFAKVLTSLPLSAAYNSEQSYCTLFVPLHVHAEDVDTPYKCQQFILTHTLEHALPYKYLRSSGAMYLDTRHTGTKILVENVGSETPVINRKCRILASQVVGSAVIFIIDRSIPMDINPLGNVGMY